ncbi:MAG: AAA+-type ATPase [Pleopsidium flavum]|nr:MAG: AAA+-type ATPase [Pleopsidium flavum]
MAEAPKYTVRPFSKQARTDLKDAFRIYLSPATLLLHKLRAGDPCHMYTAEKPPRTAIAWTASEKIQHNVVQTSKVLQTLYGFRLGDKVSISQQETPVQDVINVSVLETTQDNGLLSSTIEQKDQRHWEWFLELPLSNAEFICIGMIFENVELKDSRRTFTINTINGSPDSPDIFHFIGSSRVCLQSLASSSSTQRSDHGLEISNTGIGGLDRQLRQLNERLAAYNTGHRRLKMPSWYRRRRGAILLHGPTGTGKSLILEKIASAPWHKVLFFDSLILGPNVSDGVAAVRKVFAEAHRYQPSVIIVDQLETIASKTGFSDGTRGASMVWAIRQELDRIGDSKVLFIAATRRLTGIDESLRVPGRLEFEIEIPIPDANARIEILKVLHGLPTAALDARLERLGERTHGYVGADLMALLQLAADKAEARYLQVSHPEEVHSLLVNGNQNQTDTPPEPSKEDEETLVTVTETDLDEALTEIRPTAMREVFLEAPKVRWSDIGGQHKVKQNLKEAVEWPFKYPRDMERLGIEPKKGLLLYGPPGCSKTLIAKAVATEAGLNFIAVKGAELLNMYVGESERAVREVFRKARAASPSIIFFDEIDAIGSSRGEGSSHSGLNVLTTLLNEMDGIEVLKGVFVLAATNKPEVLDPALMRPGRLDTVLYVGLPDPEARKEILDIRLRRMDVRDDIAVNELAKEMEGYSGAEIVSICQRAGYAALKDQEDTGVNQQIGREHFHLALAEVSPMTTPEMMLGFEEWASRGTRGSRRNIE